MRQIIVPSARDRWQAGTLARYTPDAIEGILRSALLGGQLVAVWELFNLMEETWPELTSALMELKDDVASADLTVQPWALKGDEPSAEAQRRAKLFEQSLWTMRPQPQSDENDLRGTIKDLLDAWGKGLSLLEIDWQVLGLGSRVSGPGTNPQAPDARPQSLIVPRDTRWIHPRYYGYPFYTADLQLNAMEIALSAGGSGQLSVVSGPLTSQWAPIPENKFLIGIAKAKSGHPIGGALLRNAAWWWAASNFAAEWLLNFAQIFGLPIRWATYDPARPGLLKDICTMLENMGSAGYGAFPSGTTIELKEPGRASEMLPQGSIIDRANRMIRLLILGQTLTGDEGASGSRALGEVHERILGGRKRAALDWACAVLSYQLAPAFCRLNFGDDAECPWVRPAESEEEETPLEKAQRDEILSKIGFQFEAQAAYDRHKLPLPAPGAALIERPIQPAPDGAPGGEGQGEGGDQSVTAARGPSQLIQARDATDQLIDHVLEDLTGVQAKWLGGIKPFFRALVQNAQNDRLSDADFLRALDAAQKQLPELFDTLDHQALESAFYQAMSAAAVNGAVKGALKRKLVNRKS